MEANQPDNSLFEVLRRKSQLKQDVYQITHSTFRLFKNVILEMVADYQQKYNGNQQSIPFEYRDRGEFELELRFGGDVLIFMMHTNIFEFSRMHEVMKTTYIHDDKQRSYCGVINIYNFLADSFRYNRINDLGYMIGRVFVNKDNHYFIEGKREIGMLFNNFSSSVMTKESARQIVESSVLYTINFDLLTPPYDQVKEVTVFEMQASLENMKLRTGKRLGFRFQADHEEFRQ
ncbi:hypothetical protein [Lentimicrobium sp.]|jgi:hypothetical protein|uniref:hypothetical protein n=1 Tax=Lentimicrobium sp. TaxID=2034841 RepID=UPI002B56912D|nr:hypothetical protein [Lentimicrobium sp.]HOP13898.1 hypothetical protein [Lentimicrobium sp.]HPJ63267.1 hypothetical protein [Lentimicrobium sp.]HRW69040.1 hypothetical protein [Lentimicrobium sp.]